MDYAMSQRAVPKLVVSSSILMLISVAGLVRGHSRADVGHSPVRFAEDPAWVEIYLHSDQLEGLSDRYHSDRLVWERHLGRTPRLTEAWARLSMANKQWSARRQRQAKAAWNDIAFEYSDTDAAYASLANLAKVLQAQGQIPGAIEAYTKILDMKRPVLHEKDMRYANYRHTACCELSRIYEQSGDLVLAEKYARQTVEQDEFYDWCGMYAHSVEQEMIERVSGLKARMLDQEQKKNSPTRH